MDEHRLKCFVAVYEQGSVSAAAERLHMTQPPLSILLRKLEEELKVSLFDRSGHRLVPTATGELFYLRAKALQASLQAVRRELREAEQGSRGTVHIGCATAASLFLMPRVMEQLMACDLKITVHVHEGETVYMLQRLRERSLDLIICRSQYTAPELQNLEIMTSRCGWRCLHSTRCANTRRCRWRRCAMNAFCCTAHCWARAFRTCCCAPASRPDSPRKWHIGAWRPCPCC